MTTNVIPTTGLEYTLSPDGTPTGAEIGGPNSAYPYPGSQTPYSWSDVTISYDSSPALNGYRVQTRYKTAVLTPAVPEVPSSPGNPSAVPPVPANPGSPAVDAFYTYVYPEWHLVSQTLTCTSHATETPGNPFETNLGNEYLLAPNAVYGPLTTAPSSSGITDGKKYDYFKVFDQTQIDHIAALSAYNAPPLDNQKVPTSPYAPSATPPEYPIDTVTSFVPDERESVVVSYSLTTVWNLNVDSGDANYNDADFTDTITFTQTVNQNVGDWKGILKQMINRSYYNHNLTPWMPDGRTPPDPTPGIPTDGSPYYPDAT